MVPADARNGGWGDGGVQKFHMDEPSLESNFRNDRLIISRKVRGLIGAFMEVSTQRADGWGLFAFKGGQAAKESREEKDPGHSGAWRPSEETVARIRHLKWKSNKQVIQKGSLGHGEVSGTWQA